VSKLIDKKQGTQRSWYRETGVTRKKNQIKILRDTSWLYEGVEFYVARQRYVNGVFDGRYSI
jgi:hypothetical protein